MLPTPTFDKEPYYTQGFSLYVDFLSDRGNIHDEFLVGIHL